MSLTDSTIPSNASSGQRLGLYGKALSGAVVAGLSAYSAALQDGSGVSAGEWISILLSVIGSFGLIWAVPQTPRLVATYGKLLCSGITAAGAALITGLTDGSLDQTEIVTAVIAFLVASGLTGSVSNAASSDPVDVTTGKIVPVSASVKAALVSNATDVV